MQELLTFILDAPILLLNGLSFFIGLIAGHRMALGRDRRKEFNDLATGPYATLSSSLGTLEFGTPGAVAIIPRALLDCYMRAWNRRGFNAACDRYTRALQGCNSDYEYGHAIYSPAQIAELKAATIALMRFLRPR